MNDKVQQLIPLPHLNYNKNPCMGKLHLFNSKKMTSTYQCQKCGAIVKVAHGRSYNEIQQMKGKK